MGGLVYAYDNMLTEDGIRTSAVALGRVTGARKTGTGKAQLIVSGNSTYPEVLDYRLTVTGTNIGSVVQVLNPPRKVPGFKGQGVTMTDITVDGTGIFTPPSVGSLFAKCLFPAIGSEKKETYSIFGEGEHYDEDGELERGMGARQKAYGAGASRYEVKVKPQTSELPLRSFGTMILAEVPGPSGKGYDIIVAAEDRETIWLGPIDIFRNRIDKGAERIGGSGSKYRWLDGVTSDNGMNVLHYKNTPPPRVGSCIQVDCYGQGFDIGTLGFQFYRIENIKEGFSRTTHHTVEGTMTGLSGTWFLLTLDRRPSGTFCSSDQVQAKVHLVYNSAPQGTFAVNDYVYFGSSVGTVDPSEDNSIPFFLYDVLGASDIDNIRQRVTLNLKWPQAAVAGNGFGGTAGLFCYWANKDGETRDYRLRMQVNTYADTAVQKTYDYINAGGFPITTAADVQRVVNFGGWKEDSGPTFEEADSNIEIFSAGVFNFRRETIGVQQPNDLKAAVYNIYSMGWGSSIRNGQIHLFPSFVGYGLYDLADGEFVAARKAGTRDIDNWFGTYLSFTINDPDYNSQAGDKFVAEFVPMFNEVGGATYDIDIAQIGTLQADVRSSTSNVKAPFGHSVRFVRAPGKDLELNDKWEWKGQHVYGKNRLLDLKRDTSWRSNSIDGTIIIDFDAGSVIYPDRIIVHDHNLSSTGSLWIQHSGNSASSRGTLAAFYGGSVLIDTNKSWTDDEWVAKSIWITSGSWRGSVFEIADNTGTTLKLKYGADVVSQMFRGESYLLQWSSPDYEQKISSWTTTSTASVSGQSARYWRIQIWDPDNTNGEVRVGGLWLGRQFAPGNQPVRPYSRPAVAKASRVETSSGHESSYVFSRRREYQITYNKITDSDYDSIISMWEHSFTPGRGIRPFYMIQDSDASGSTKLVYFSDNAIQDSYMHFTDIGFRLREVTKST